MFNVPRRPLGGAGMFHVLADLHDGANNNNKLRDTRRSTQGQLFEL